MFKNILIALVLASMTSLGCGGTDNPQHTTIESADCSGGALCLVTDVAEASNFCTGQVSLTDQSNGTTYLAQLPGYPMLSFLESDIEEKQVFNVTISAPCADIDLEKMVFDVNVHDLGFSVKPSIFEMYYNGYKVGKVSGFVSGDVSLKNEMIVEWSSDELLISKSFDNNGSFALVCLNCEAFPKVTVCLRSVQWKIMLYDGHDSETYSMGTPQGCQTTQF